VAAATDLYDLCREYLEACEEAVVLAPAGAIDRAFVSPGPPAWDCCPQLTVHAGGPSQADTAPLGPPLQIGHRISDPGAVNLVTMTATVLRCSPTLGDEGDAIVLPDAAELDASAEEVLGDVWAIWNHLATRKLAGTLWAPKERELIFDPAVALNPAGGCSGWQIQIRVQLGGYRTVI
jgi:hypothetical protein